MKIDPKITYLKCASEIPFEYEKLACAVDNWLHPYAGTFKETFIATIPAAKVFGFDGWVLVNDHLVGDQLIHDFVWQNCFLPKYAWDEVKLSKPTKKIKKMAVIAQSGYSYYYHFLVEVLGRLSLLEMQGVEYDYLYVPTHLSFMKDLLRLWGVDESKIITASEDVIYEVDELIVPSLVEKVDVCGCPRLVHYMPEYILKYVQQKLLNSINFSTVQPLPSKRVFVSRKDASARRMLNEDDVFALFEAVGFASYELSKLSVAQQIALFNQAEIIVAPLGSGSANVLFCQPDARVIEIFQTRRDCTIYYLCQTLGLSYQFIKTTDFIDHGDGQYDSFVPLEIIAEVVKNL